MTLRRYHDPRRMWRSPDLERERRELLALIDRLLSDRNRPPAHAVPRMPEPEQPERWDGQE